MSQANLFLENGIIYPHRKVPVELQRHYNPSLTPEFETEASEACYERLFNQPGWIKPMVSSIAHDHFALSRNNVNALVYDLFNKSSLNVDIVFGLPAYKTLVYEFLASLELREDRSFTQDYEGWSFRIQNKDFYWSRSEACKRLGFPEEGFEFMATERQRLDTWRSFTRLEELGENPSPYSIISDAWRYVHRLVATGINCSPETVDVVTGEDLDLLWAIEQGVPVNWFDCFSEKFRKMKGEYSTLSFVGCTSLITAIAEMCHFRFFCFPTEYRKLDMHMMKKLKLLARPHKLYESEEDPEEEEEIVRSPRKGKAKKYAKRAKEEDSDSEWEEVRMFKVKEYRKPRAKVIEIDSD